MKIVFSTDQIYLHGGIEKVMAEKANYFADKTDFLVTILTTEQKDRAVRYPLSNKINLVDIEINYNRKISYFKWENITKLYNHYKQLKKTLKLLQPDVIIVSNYSPDFYFLPFVFKKIKKIKEFHGSRYAYEAHRNFSKSFLAKMKFKFHDWIEAKYDKIIVLNPDEQPFFKTKNVVTIPNPIILSKQKSEVNFPIALAAGRIAPVKGFENLISAWKVVHQHLPNWQLLIYGENYLGTMETLKAQIDDSGLEEVVLFKGSTDHIIDVLSNSSIYIMSSETECFPMVLLEALSVGVPIVSFNCPTGPKNIISNEEDGFLIDQNDIGEMATKIIMLANNFTLRKQMSAKAIENVKRFDVDIIMKKWLTTLRAL